MPRKGTLHPEPRMKPTYEELFSTNLGIFSPAEMEKIRRSNVLVVGCGGVGGAVAIILGRSGIGSFILADPESFEPSNMNRQITCFLDTLGKNKAEITALELKRINPEVSVEVHTRYGPKELKKMLEKADVVVLAADDFAWDVYVAREASKLGKPVVVPYPTGLLSRVTVVMPGGSVEDCFGLPRGLPYRILKKIIESPLLRKKFRKELELYRKEGGWRDEWFEDFLNTKVPLAQICPMVYLTASLAALEVLKLVTGRLKPVIAPKHWCITASGASIREFRPPAVGSKLRLLGKLARA
ncbi:MAG: ThiF family adenylyltransferase [Candidatus Hadarchaeales archaeon]